MNLWNEQYTFISARPPLICKFDFLPSPLQPHRINDKLIE